MKSGRIVVASMAVLATAACGGGGDSQDELADEFIDRMEEEGVEVDDGCVRDAFDQLDDDDAQAVLDSLDDSIDDSDPPDVSPDAVGIVDDLLGCLDIGSLFDDIDISDMSIPDVSIPDVSLPDVSLPDVSIPDMDEFLEDLDIEGLDADCFQDILDDTDMSTADPQELAAAAFECIDLGG